MIEMFFPSISKLISIDEVERIEWNDINKKDEQQKKKNGINREEREQQLCVFADDYGEFYRGATEYRIEHTHNTHTRHFHIWTILEWNWNDQQPLHSQSLTLHSKCEIIHKIISSLIHCEYNIH